MSLRAIACAPVLCWRVQMKVTPLVKRKNVHKRLTKFKRHQSDRFMRVDVRFMFRLHVAPAATV